MNVTSLASYRYREELAVLDRLTRRLMRGEIRGLAICALGSDNNEEISVTGNYRADPRQGVAVGMRLSWRLTQLADDLEAQGTDS